MTEKERNKLVNFGSKLGKALNELVTIVHPDTLRRWIREAEGRAKRERANVGRPRTKEEIRDLIIKLARENDWGYTRIIGELKKLGIKPPSRNAVKNILKETGLKPGPKRGAGTWDEFLKIHAASLWRCDFYAKKVLTLKGFRDLYLLVFLHVETRRVFIAPSTFHRNEAWVNEQAQAFLEHVEETGLETTIVIHDRDTKFTASFDEVLESAGLEAEKAAHRSPNTVAFVERSIQTLQQECLDYFIVFGEHHMDCIVKELVTHYHEERPHQSTENDPLVPVAPELKPTKAKRRNKDESPRDVIPVSQVECRQRLGRLLKHYYRKVA